MNSRRGAGVRNLSAFGIAAILLVAGACGSTGSETVRRISPEESTQLPPRDDPTAAWTGAGLFVYGGREWPGSGDRNPTLLNDAAVINPDSGTVTQPIKSPFAVPLIDPLSISSAGRVLVFGRPCPISDSGAQGDQLPCGPNGYVGAALDSSTNEWKTLKLPETLATAAPDEVGVVGETEGQVILVVGASPAHYWVYDVAKDTWRALPDRPGNETQRDACVAPNALYVLDAVLTQDGTPVADPSTQRVGIVGPNQLLIDPKLSRILLNGPDPKWTLINPPEFEFAFDIDPQLACTSGAVAAVGGAPKLRGIAYSQKTQTWTHMPDLDGVPANRVIVTIGDDFWVAGTTSRVSATPTSIPTAFVYNVASSVWVTQPLGEPGITQPATVWNGAAIVGYASSSDLRLPAGSSGGAEATPTKPGPFVLSPTLK